MQHPQLPEVHLRDEHLLVARARPRPCCAGTGSGGAGAPSRPCGRVARTRRAAAPIAPYVEPQPRTSVSRAVGIVDLELGDVGRDAGDLRGAQPHHQVVVLGVVRDVAGLVLLLEAADAVLEARRAGDRPRPRERLGVALVGEERVAVVRLRSRTRSRCRAASSTSGISHGSEPFARYASESRKTGVRYLIAMRAASIAASKQPDGRRGGDDGHGRLRVPAEHHHQQVGLLGLRRHPGRRPGALDVDDQRAAARASPPARPSRT